MATSNADKIFNQMACIEAGIAYEDAWERFTTKSATIDEWLASLPEAERNKAKRKFRKLWRKRAKVVYSRSKNPLNLQKPQKRMLAMQEARLAFDAARKAESV
jgi:hypothetical protein